MTCASGRDGLEASKRRQAVEPGHHDVEQHDVGRLALFHRGEQLVAAGVAPRLVAAQRKEGSEDRRRTPNRRRRWRRKAFSSSSVQGNYG